MRYAEVPLVDETALRHGVLEVANLYGRYGYRTVCGLLSGAGWQTSEAVVRRIWRQEGLKVPKLIRMGLTHPRTDAGFMAAKLLG